MLVDFKIDGKKYKIECPADEEGKVLKLAQAIDKKAKKLRLHLKTADEKTLLAILCLTLQDEANSNSTKDPAKNDNKETNKIEEQLNLEAVKNIVQATKKIEDLAKKIERC